MSKNLTRKGLAFGALVALTSTVIAGTPAFAIDEVTLAPKTGTSYSLISGETFTLTAATGSLVPSSSFGSLKTKVTNNSAIAYTTGSTQAGAVFTGTGAQASTVASVVIEDNDGGASSGIADVTIAVAATAAGNFTVQSWLDANGNDLIDDAFVSPVRTVTFVKPADVTATTTITAPTAGDTTISAKIAFDGINNEQIPQSHVGAFFTKGDGTTLYPTTAAATAAAADGTTITYTVANNFVAGQTVTTTGFTAAGFNLTNATIATASSTGFTVTNALAAATATVFGTASVSAAAAVKSNVAWSSTDSFKYTTDAVSALVKDAAVKVQPLYKLAGSPASTDTIAAAKTATIAARVAATIVGGAVASATAKDNVAGTSVTSLLNSSFAVKAVVKDGATVPAVLANRPVTAVITATGLTSTAPAKTLSVNGTVYSDSSLLPGQGSVAKLALTTNASGEAIINFTTAGFADTATFTVVFYTENLTAGTITVTQAAAAYTLTVDNQAAISSAVDGSSVPVSVSVYDQFGGVPANEYDVTATLTGSGQATTAATAAGSNAAATLTGGKATINLVENGTGNGNNVYDLKVQKRLAGNVYGTTVTTAVVHTVKITDAANLVAGTITSGVGVQDSTTKVYAVAGTVALSLVDLKNADTRKILETAPTFANTQVLSGTVTTAATATSAAVAVAGAKVTISAPGLQFGAGSVYASGSITVVADANGAWSANVASHKAGKQTITVTSGAASATITVVFAAAADTTGTSLVVDAPAYILPGRTLVVTGVLTDKYGNAINTVSTTDTTNNETTELLGDLVVSYDGPGLIVGALPTETDADGKFSLRVLLGANETGSATVTAKYDANGDADYADTGDLSAAKTVVIGSAPVAAPAYTVAASGSTGKFFVSATGAANKTVVVKVAGKFVKSFKPTSADKKAIVIAATKGSKAVTVFVGGKLALTKKVTVK
jgi:hypothetical protein